MLVCLVLIISRLDTVLVTLNVLLTGKLQKIVNKLANIGQLSNFVLLIALDVTSLYTNMPYNDEIQACCDFLHRRINPDYKTLRSSSVKLNQ